jgi:hypothetical protein
MMNNRVNVQKNQASTAAPVQNHLPSRPFPGQAKSEASPTQQETTEGFGHNLANIPIFAPTAASAPIQAKLVTPQDKDVAINADPQLEAEANTMGAKAASGQQVEVTGAAEGIQRMGEEEKPGLLSGLTSGGGLKSMMGAASTGLGLASGVGMFIPGMQGVAAAAGLGSAALGMGSQLLPDGQSEQNAAPEAAPLLPEEEMQGMV